MAEQLEQRWLLAADPIISEFLAQNNTINTDENGDHSDWVEIYNPDTNPVSLNGWFLSDNRAKLNKWKFPNVSLGAGKFLLVWASNKNRVDPAKPLHTNFALSADGEYLGLTRPDGATIVSEFSPSFPAQLPDISYGVRPDTGALDYLKPTPAAANSTQGIVADTKFDHDRGFYTAPFDVAITTDTPGASIRYTTDGTPPTASSGTLYTGPVHISTTTVLRAMAYKSGFTSTDVDAETYLFTKDIVKQPTNVAGYPNPQEPLNTPGNADEIDVPLDYGMDPTIINDPAYAKADEALKSIPTLSIGMNKGDIFGPNGFYDSGLNDDGVEKPISFEYIDPAHPEDNIQVNAGISGHSKPKLKRSMNVHFRSSYGASKLQDAVFQHAPVGGDSATDEIDQLILRGGNNRAWTTASPAVKDTTFTEDEFVRQNQIAMTGVGTHGTFVHLYINGLYWGLYNMVERPDAGYGAAYFGGNKNDWFAISQDGVQDGDATRWNDMINNVLPTDMSNAANYNTLKSYLDVKNYADYIISQWYAGVTDWPWNNFWAGGDTVKKTPFQFFSWDGEFMMNSTYPFSSPPNGAWVHPYFKVGDNSSATSAILKIWRSVRNSDEFMTMFADRAYKALFNNGALTDANATARWDALNSDIGDAVMDESARWGDSMISTGRPRRTRDGDWKPAVKAIRDLLQGNAQQWINAARAAGFYPSIDPATMSQPGGLIPSGFKLGLTNPNPSGTIYYTTDGSDPRLPGGGINPGAKIYTGSKITLTANTLVRLRVKDGGTWSAMNESNFTINTIANLRVTELMYHPKAPDNAPYIEDDYEYIEFKNVGNSPLSLNGVQLADGINFTFGNISLAAGDHILVVKNRAAFESVYGTGLNIAGEYDGKLSNSGDEIQLIAPGNILLADFAYDATWYPSTDGTGYSLVVVDPTDDPSGLSNKAAWKPSSALGGTPDADESSIPANAVVINEILSASSGPLGDQIELLNTTTNPIDISNWYISDSLASLKKFKIPAGTTLAGGAFIVFNELNDFASAFGFSSTGETAYLSSADATGALTGYQAVQKFGAAAEDVPFARFMNSAGAVKFVAETAATFGQANAAPLVGPIVINEIHYNPANALPEFLEIENVSSGSVDLTGWTFSNGITFTFGAAALDAGALAVLTPGDPNTVRSTYHIAAGVQIFQFTGALDNSGERIELSQPKVPGGTDLILMDAVSFDDIAPWPVSPDGMGPSLAKTASTLFGDDPISWQASTLNNGTPGRENNAVNQAPAVSAGDDQSILPSASANLTGTAGDDGLPAGLSFTTTWTKLSGPGSVSFTNASSLATAASFSNSGTYVLRLTASDGLLSSSDDVNITVITLPTITIAASDADASEAGTDTGAFTVTRSGNLSGDLTVKLSASTGSATAGVDYDALPASVLIPDGQATATVMVTPKDDADVEGTEDVTLSVAADATYLLGANTTATVHIADDDVPPEIPLVTLAATDAAASEPGTNTGLFTITRAGNLGGDLTVNLNAPTGTAGSGIDYVALPTSVTILDGQASATVLLTPKDDALVEQSETVTLSLAAGSGYLFGASTSATVTIADDDVAPPPAFAAKINFQPLSAPAVSGYLVDSGLVYGNRGNGLSYGWKSDISSIMRDRDAANSPDQRYDTLAQMGAAATQNWEIAVPNGTYSVHLVAGDAKYFDSTYKINAESTLLINGVPTAATHWFENTTNVIVADGRLTISNAAGAINNKIDYIEITSVGAVTPTLPQVTIAATTPAAAEQNLSAGVFTVTRAANDLSKPLTVNFTIGGTATNGSDYDTLPLTVTIPANQTSATITVKPKDDAAVEPSETVLLTLAGNPAYSIGSASAATVTIADNDKAPAGFSAKINFQPVASPVPAGYLVDSGAAYGARGSGQTYGWMGAINNQTKDRNNAASPDQRYDTLLQGITATNFWEIAVPNGKYQVHLVAGDSNYFDSVYKFSAEGTAIINGTPTAAKHWIEGTLTVTVTDGKLTIASASGAVNNKLDYIDVQQV